jgi:hypothetical protein
MADQAISMPRSLPSISDQSAGRNPYQRPRRRPEERWAEERGSGDYLPTAIEAPDPNQPLYEALDRIRAVERPADEEYLRAIHAVKAYEHTERTVRLEPTTTFIRSEPPPVT